ncbi:MAG: glycosyl hydrolase family 65 protein [Candidatus Hydrothermarchaeaceae archaeon]
MKDYFEKYLSDEEWQIVEEGWNPKLQNVNETLFTLGNGYIGSRGILEEIPPKCRPGTFFAGVYGGSRALVPELINAPNPIDLRISVKGEKLGVVAMDMLSHKRTLDMHKGTLVRHTIYSNARKKRYDYQSMRFFSKKNNHVAAMRVYLTPLDEDATFTITNSIDTSIMNMGLVTEGDKKHVDAVETGRAGSVNYTCSKTFETGILITCCSQIVVEKGKKTYSVPDWTFKLRLKRGETACITNYLSFYTSLGTSMEESKKQATQLVSQCAKKGFEKILEEHFRAWGKKWKTASVEILGDKEIEKAVRFNIYQLIIAANEDFSDNSIGAKALTGEGYRGHVFWDAEIFCLPFFLYTYPTLARNLLMYRYHRLPKAREIAREMGYRGAMFPWESAETGHETTPTWYKDGEGKIQKIRTNEQEHHITADVAFSVLNYFWATGDEDFLLDYGLEILLETARFWSSRVEYNRGKKRYDINHVIGPDEFHEDVNNNVYTNIMAKHNLNEAASLHQEFLGKYPGEVKKLKKKIGLKSKDPEKWLNIASKIPVPRPNKTGIIEQFDGFFKRKKLPLPELNNWQIPGSPKNSEMIGDTQYVKQADVVMVLYLFPELYSAKIKRKNYQFYEKRTLHHSSLSPSVHSAVGAEVGEEEKAYRYFEISANIDLKNIYGNTDMGIHAASLGGTWQAMVHGFSGIRVREGHLTFNPRLPSKWKRIKLFINFKGFVIAVDIYKKKLSLYFHSRNKSDILNVRVYGKPYELLANRKSSFKKGLNA